MKYYLIEVTTYVDGTPTAKAIYGAYSEKDAVANFHSKLGGAMKNDNYATELVMVVSEQGAVIKSEYYVKPNEVTE